MPASCPRMMSVRLEDEEVAGLVGLRLGLSNAGRGVFFGVAQQTSLGRPAETIL
jgi:hypothetical protein